MRDINVPMTHKANTPTRDANMLMTHANMPMRDANVSMTHDASVPPCLHTCYGLQCIDISIVFHERLPPEPPREPGAFRCGRLGRQEPDGHRPDVSAARGVAAGPLESTFARVKG
ncbi:hypothetical protein Y1Q_0023678 [Alligator mississippiensis]|uniref:Uncharacterized protein n=1 Tax=Alligator mississippiensis TaxID=8496 RepID=A0A151NBQ7_ALLMI|nr:hypothetical protein Y1Q_0023678 [Alligator mississippiensis]